LRRMLAGWAEDLPPRWRRVLAGTELNWNSLTLDGELTPGEIVFPGRKGERLVSAPAGAQLLRAFEDADPDKVRVVLLGQDPYPNPAWATGRAFEQGNLTGWPTQPRSMADSLRRIVQAIIGARTANRAYQNSDRAWSKLVADEHDGVFQLEPPGELFNRLEQEGVLFLNTSLTIGVLHRAGPPNNAAVIISYGRH
jgi:uracil-DNA glycosylase